jgi:hypothetical protein
MNLKDLYNQFQNNKVLSDKEIMTLIEEGWIDSTDDLDLLFESYNCYLKYSKVDDDFTFSSNAGVELNDILSDLFDWDKAMDNHFEESDYIHDLYA